MGEAIRSVVRRALVIGMVQAMIFARAPAGAAVELPSLDEIKVRLRKQRDKVQSLYVETVVESTSPLTLKELRRVPGYERFSGFTKTENQFAFKGEKRYERVRSRHKRPELPPIPPLRLNATPLEKALHRYWVENEKKRKEQEARHSGPTSRQSDEDRMKGYNGRAFWQRYITEVEHPDGRVEKKPPTVVIWSPVRVSRLLPPWGYLTQIGMAIAVPDISAENLQFQDRFRRNLLPDLLERWAYTVSDEVEQVDGAPCVVLRGTIETTFTLLGVTEKRTTHDTLWLDLDRGLALRKRQRRTTDGRRTLHRQVNSDFEEVASGVWLPKQTESQVIAPDDDEDYREEYRGKPIFSTRVRVTKWVVNRVPDKVFEPYIQPRDTVHDNREHVGPALDP